MNIPKIEEVKILNEYELIVKFTDGKIKKYDVSRLLEQEMFASLKSYAFFKNVKVEQGGYAVFWDNNIDISEYELWKNGKIIGGDNEILENAITP
jgi:hypothetical protein